MVKRKLKNAGRPKAFLGMGETGAILAAAGINAATQMAAAGINSAATKQSAKDQAQATINAANRQSTAIKEQSEKAKEFQTEQQEFIREQNAENRELQRDIQMQLQMLTGQQNINDRLEASRLAVKNGGRTKPKLSLRGGNMPFKVTDGGYVLPVGTTPEGFDLYEIRGNNHEHYHKTRGKYKSGVGIKFADGNIVEGEGNQNTNQGEYMLETPNAAYFISKHNIAGFNPAKAINGGMHPLMAYNIQEQQKAINGITDNGKSPRRKSLMGGFANNLNYNMIVPDMSTDVVAPVSVGVASRHELRKGGACRRRAKWGTDSYERPVWINDVSNTDNIVVPYAPGEVTNTSISEGLAKAKMNTVLDLKSNNNNNTNTKTKSGSTFTRNADLWGAGIGALGNLGGAWITSAANRSAARTLADAYNKAGDITAEAYRSLTGIDMNTINREDYRAAHAMPALQAPVSFAARQIAGADRSLQRRLSNAGKYSASGAAAQQRMAEAEVATQDAKNTIYSEDQKQMQNIRQANAERVSQAAMLNAQLDTEANKQFAQDYMKLLQYNNDIDNTKILGAADALSEAATNAAGAISNAQTSNGAAWAQAMLNSSQGFANSLSNMATRNADLQKVILGASGDTRANYYGSYGNKSDALVEYNRLKAQYDLVRNSSNTGDKDTAAMLRRQINAIATARGFKTV